MKRRVIQQGPSTLMISLPSKWVKKNNITKGDEIEIIEKNTELSILCKPKKESKTISADFRNLRSTVSLTSAMINLFIQGYTRIEIRYSPKTYRYIVEEKKEYEIDTITFIQKRVADMIGVEIIEDKPGRCVIEQITDPDPSAFLTTFKRGFLLLLEQVDVLAQQDQRNKRGKEGVFSNFFTKHYTIDRFLKYSKKLLHLTDLNPDEKERFHVMIHNIQLIGYSYATFSTVYKKDDSDALKKVNIILRKYYEESFKTTSKDLNNLSEMVCKIQAEFAGQDNRYTLLLCIVNIIKMSIKYLPILDMIEKEQNMR